MFMWLALVLLGLYSLCIASVLIVKRDLTTSVKAFMLFHLISLSLMLTDLLLTVLFDRSFRGIWIDRLLPQVVLLTGLVLLNMPSRHVDGSKIRDTRLLLSTFAALLFPVPMLVCFPDTYLSDARFDVRTLTGLMAPKQLELVEKDLLTERTFGRSQEDFPIPFEFTKMDLRTDSAHVKQFLFSSHEDSLMLTFRPE